jgi:hypothetical protein
VNFAPVSSPWMSDRNYTKHTGVDCILDCHVCENWEATKLDKGFHRAQLGLLILDVSART